jgi:hypothetical protein
MADPVKDLDTFRAELSTVLQRYRGVLDPLVLVNAANDILARYIIPGAPMPDPTPPPEAPESPLTIAVRERA